MVKDYGNVAVTSQVVFCVMYEGILKNKLWNTVEKNKMAFQFKKEKTATI